MTNFDERAKDWDSDPAKVERARVVAEAIRSGIPFRSGMNALEYGCGTGLLSFALQPYLTSVTLADTSQGMLDVLSEKIAGAGVNNMHPMRLDLTNGRLPAEKYQLIYSLMTLHHIHDIEKVLKHFYTLLEPNGYLCISDLDKEDGSFHTSEFDGHHGFERKSFQAMMEKTGFKNIRFSTIFEIKRNADKSFPLFLMIATK